MAAATRAGVGGHGCQQPIPQASWRLLTILPATCLPLSPPVTRQVEKLRPRVRSGCQDTEATRRVWLGSGRCTQPGATLAVTQSS